MKTVNIEHQGLGRPLLTNVPLALAAQILEHDEDLQLNASYNGRIIFDASNDESEAADILKVLTARTA